MSNLVDHARRELALINEDPWVIDGICKVIAAFAEMGHSGPSAAHTTSYLERLLRYEPLTDLTDSPAEWEDRYAEGLTTSPLWQSVRNPAAMSKNGGRTYYLISELDAAGSMDATPIHHSKPAAA